MIVIDLSFAGDIVLLYEDPRQLQLFLTYWVASGAKAVGLTLTLTKPSNVWRDEKCHMIASQCETS